MYIEKQNEHIEFVKKIIDMYNDGYRVDAICKKLNISKQLVYYYLKQTDNISYRKRKEKEGK